MPRAKRRLQRTDVEIQLHFVKDIMESMPVRAHIVPPCAAIFCAS